MMNKNLVNDVNSGTMRGKRWASLHSDKPTAPPPIIVLQLREAHVWVLQTFKALLPGIKIIIIIISVVAILIGFRQLTYVPGYCSETKHYHTDAEIIAYSKRILKAETKDYGGIDSFEKWLIENNYHPEIAGRDFNPNDPECCKVYRGTSETKRGCGIDDYPICVRLHFPPLKELPKGKTYYKREGRTYLFDDCGNHRESFYLSS